MIEILSQGTRKRDLTIKRQLFDREGVREYWIVDPDRNSVAVYRRADDAAASGLGTAAPTPLPAVDGDG